MGKKGYIFNGILMVISTIIYFGRYELGITSSQVTIIISAIIVLLSISSGMMIKDSRGKDSNRKNDTSIRKVSQTAEKYKITQELREARIKADPRPVAQGGLDFKQADSTKEMYTSDGKQANQEVKRPRTRYTSDGKPITD